MKVIRKRKSYLKDFKKSEKFLIAPEEFRLQKLEFILGGKIGGEAKVKKALSCASFR